MPHLWVVPDEPAPSLPEERDRELRVIADELAELLLSIAGGAYALRSAPTNSVERRDLGAIEDAAGRGRILVARLRAVLRSGAEPRPGLDTIPATYPDWEGDQGRS
jgi:hypothetical protein